ncbi:MAG: hypothetical protein EOP86_09850 [Verrucomicrobiaceae bacterium]|nr:MAG: hypothetical protein EOP86_09850 [Verrucomicrobiaceae bacterium]
MNPVDKIKAVQAALGVARDGRFGPLSRAALECAAPSVIRAVQSALGVTADGLFGPVSRAALNAAIIAADSWLTPRTGLASSFADPKDIADFRECKATGKSDRSCFAVGDNGVGCWGADTTVDVPMCALPPEDWAHLTRPAGTLVEVTVGSRSVVCQLQDKMPAKANIRNGAVIDLNKAAWDRLGHQPPVKKPCSWRWAA